MTDPVGPFEFAAKAAFYPVAFATVIGAVITVSARNLFRAGLGLALALFGVAVVYLYLDAEFLAAAQLLIYVGAILTLLLFGVMLTARIADPALPRWNKQAVWAFGVAACIGAGTLRAFLSGHWVVNPTSPVPLPTLGWVLIRAYLLPFELLGLLLLGALVGAMVVARKEKEGGSS